MKRLRLRGWVKVVIGILIFIILVQSCNYINSNYDRCMKYNNNNENICSKLKN